jgi:glycosyltransferase involved in cell wall biosynthesis
MRRLLMISYFFPPTREVGRVRSVKFCKYLPQFGYQGVVLTSEIPAGADLTSLKEIPPQTEVHRIGLPTLVTRAREVFRAMRGVARRFKAGAAGSAAQAPVPVAQAPAQGVNLSHGLCWPDDAASWIPAATRKAMALARSCDAIFSTGNPWSDQLVALRVQQFTHLPWIMDFRDPWMQGGSIDYPFALQRRLFERLEARCVARCDRLVNVTPALTQRYRQAYPDQPPEKFLTIPNGYDADDFRDMPAPPQRLPLTMTYVGTLFCGRTAAPLAQAVTMLRDSGRLRDGQLRIQLIGDINPAEQQVVAQAGLSDVFAFQPHMPYAQVLLALARSHVALLIGGPQFDTVSLPTKLFDYFALGKPVLALLPEGPLKTMLAEAGTACVDRDNPARIADGIAAMLDQFLRCGGLVAPAAPDIIRSATRQATAGHLAGELDRLLDRRMGRGECRNVLRIT